MSQQVMDGYASLVSRNAGKVSADRIRHQQLAIGFEREDGGCGELLGAGPYIENGVRCP